jgi:hypothetical protein
MIGGLRKVAFGEPASAKVFYLRWIVRPIAFGLPLSVVAAWCGIQLSWGLVAWTMFCVVWSDCVDGIGKQD